jgi:uroporphyrinogen-III synthase
MSTKDLTNRIVLVTRPQHQAASLAQQIEAAGAKALLFPTIEIQSLRENPHVQQTFVQINQYDMLIFTSANAVLQAQQILQSMALSPESIEAQIAVIGRATQAAAKQAGFKVSIQPEQRFNSEALLALSQMQLVSNQRILLVRGQSGLELLAETLRERGALVDYAEVYCRAVPVIDTGLQRHQLSEHWAEYGITDIIVTSNESLQNLYDMLEMPATQEMLKVHLLVPSKRCVTLANSLGFQWITQAESALNQHMINALFE